MKSRQGWIDEGKQTIVQGILVIYLVWAVGQREWFTGLLCLRTLTPKDVWWLLTSLEMQRHIISSPVVHFCQHFLEVETQTEKRQTDKAAVCSQVLNA
jgi:hypothetical protein